MNRKTDAGMTNEGDVKDATADNTLSRRAFLDGVALTVGAAAAASLSCATPTQAAAAAPGAAAAGPTAEPAAASARASVPPVDTSTPPMNSPEYPPGLQGLRGQPNRAWQVPHAIRDGKTFGDAVDTGESYDLIVVGAGASGLAAAYFYKKKLPRARILVLEAADDFGGVAKRTEFVIKGRRYINCGGALAIQYAGTYTPEGKTLLADIGVNAERYWASVEETAAQKKGPAMELDDATFFDRETWGSDRLVRSYVDPYVANRRGPFPTTATPAELAAKWTAFLKEAPFSARAKRDILRVMTGTKDYMAGLSVEEKIERLKRMTYRDYLVNVLRVTPEVFDWWQIPLTGYSNAAAGPETYSAWTAYRRGMGGFQGMGLPTSVLSIADYLDDEEAGKWIVFPDGLYSISRLLIRWLNPEALPGSTQEDSIHSRFNYGALDKPEKAVRIRLNSPVVQVRHVGDPATAKQVEVCYVNNGRALKAKGGAVVMACYNSMIPYVCPELPEEQKAALRLSVRAPVHMTTLALNNWRAFAKARINYVYFPTMPGMHVDFWGPYGGYETPCLGVDQRVTHPDEPLIITAWNNWRTTNLPPRDSFRAERARYVELTEADYRKDLETKLQRVLGPYGFDADKDIEGMIVNRFGHGMAGGMNSLFDPEPPRPDQEHFVTARRRFNLIAIANSDASGVALTQAAIDQANRAVNEIVQNLVQPQPDFEFASRV
ncbi:MAG: NAD(P)-binding protein [Steroidobacteraceae bacterium]|nr:NAD(P)-binding protein [Steroidobacteraceae bacterium]